MIYRKSIIIQIISAIEENTVVIILDIFLFKKYWFHYVNELFE